MNVVYLLPINKHLGQHFGKISLESNWSNTKCDTYRYNLWYVCWLFDGWRSGWEDGWVPKGVEQRFNLFNTRLTPRKQPYLCSRKKPLYHVSGMPICMGARMLILRILYNTHVCMCTCIAIRVYVRIRVYVCMFVSDLRGWRDIAVKVKV